MPRPVHFEIHAHDPERAIAFYQKIFGWTFTKWDGSFEYWLVTTGEDGTPGINGGLMRRQGPPPTDPEAAVNAFPCTMEVPDVDATARAITEAGGTIVVPKMPVPGLGWLIYAKDTEGNIFGALAPDVTAI